MLNNLELIGVGGSRYVYADGDYVLKVPYNNCGKKQAKNEYDLFNNELYKPYLAEIIEYNEDSCEIKQERLYDCCVIRCDNEAIKNYFPTELLTIINSNGVQVGRDKNNKLKIFDYGLEPVDARTITKEQIELMRKYSLLVRREIDLK